MRGTAVYKVPGGKLLRVSVDHEGEVLAKVSLNGDFFIHPEEALEDLERRLSGAKLQDVRRIVEDCLRDVTLYGVDGKSIVRAVWEAAA
jgi:lipoate---protein ligase